MRPSLLLSAAGLVLALAPSAALAQKPVAKTFNVSAYGVQRYTSTQTENDVKPDSCFASRGTTISRTVVTFRTAKPIRVKATSSGGGYVSLQWPDDDIEIPVIADWEHSGESDREQRACTLPNDDWVPDPPAPEQNCHQTLDNHGYSLSISGGRVEATGGIGLVPPLVDPFAGCPWGDRSVGLYGAKARVRAALIMEGEQTELVLRGRDHQRSENPDGSGSSDVLKKTTVYVVFKRR